LGEPGFELLQRVAPYRTHSHIRIPAEILERPNLYEYVENNPVNDVDVNGEFGLLEIVGIILIIAIAAPYFLPPHTHQPALPPPPPPTRPPAQTCPFSTPGDGADPDSPPWYPGNPNDPNNFPPTMPNNPPLEGDGPWSQDPDWWMNEGEGE
jgi:hypothetical protein